MTWLKKNWFYLLILIIALMVPFFVPNRYFFQIIIMSCLMAIGALSFNLLLGYTGQASLAHGAFFGIGAYGVAILTQTFEWSFWLSLPASALLAAAVGLIVGIPALRTKGAYFAIATMCLGEIIVLIAGNWIEVTGGHNGIVGINPPNPIKVLLLGEISFETQTSQYYLVLFFLLVTLFFIRRLVLSLKGLTFMAVRNNEQLAEAVGINTTNTKLLSFIFSNFIAAMAGGIYASLMGSISPSVASLKITFDFLLYVLLGGAATLAGPIIGGFALPILMEYLQFLQDYQMIFFGVLLIVVIIYFPRGLMGAFRNIQARLKNKKAGV